MRQRVEGSFLVLGEDARALDLRHAQLLEGQQTCVWDSVYDTLLIQDNSGKLQSGAAQSWQYSSDARTLTLKLRTGMKFSSGTPVDAAAVKATLERIRSTPGPSQGVLASVASVEATDADTVVIRLKRPDGSLLTSLSMAAVIAPRQVIPFLVAQSLPTPLHTALLRAAPVADPVEQRLSHWRAPSPASGTASTANAANRPRPGPS